MSHTKGPWIMRHTMLQDGNGGIEERSVVHYDSSLSDEFIARKIKTDDNARLIAAAPIGYELADAILAQDADGMDRSAWILNKAREFMSTVQGFNDRADIYRAKAEGKD